MSVQVEEESRAQISGLDIETQLRGQIENWRKRLLDVGNRNPLINCPLDSSRSALEIVHPECEVVWRQLAADVEAGTLALRFPWRRDLVPPPEETDLRDEHRSDPRGPDGTRQLSLALEGESAAVGQADSTDGEASREIEEIARREWNPPLEACLSSRRLQDTDLMTGLGDNALDRRLRTLDGHAKLSLSEQGVHSLFVAFGFVKWFESSDSDRELRSPLMLVPVSLSRTSTNAAWELTEAEDDVIDNLCLRQRFKQDFGLELPPLPEIGELEELGVRLRFLDAIRAAIAGNERWAIEDRCALGRFAFPKVAMWKDLGDHSKSVSSHALCRSVGGDSSIAPQQAFGFTDSLPEASRLDDEVAPGEIKAILDSDSSQLEAVVAARRGVSFVLDGPPGTGKSQTIANIIADALAEGRRVLFVSEKVSALEVVKRRLDDCGLGDFCLECHSSKANRKAVLDELGWCLGLPVEVYDDAAPKLDESKRQRDVLNEYVRAIHRPREPLGLSPFELNGHVARLTRLGMATKSRCSLPNPADINRQTFAEWLRLLGRATDVNEVIASHDAHPWRGCKLTSRSLSLADDIEHHFGVLSQTFQQIEAITRPLVDGGLVDSEVTPVTLNQLVKSLKESLDCPEVPFSWFASPAEAANIIIQRHAAIGVVEEQRTALAEYREDIAESFPNAEVVALLDTSHCAWTDRLVEPLPAGVREQIETLTSHSTSLNHLATQVAEAERVFASLIEQLELPISSELPVSSLPKLVRLARAIAESGPMQRGWFDSANWTRLRTACDAALTRLDLANSAASQVADHVSTERLALLHQSVPNWSDVESAWSLVQRCGQDFNEDELATLARAVDEALPIVHSASEAARSVSHAMQLRGDSQLSLRSLKTLIEALRTSGIALLNGTWCHLGISSQLIDTCKAAIDDLTEAGEIKRELQERLSHRAFKPTAVEMVRKAASFHSWFNWLFGGFSAFQREAADYYKSTLPATGTLLADFGRLGAFHRRMTEVREAAAELADYLPAGHVPDELDSWQSLLASVTAQAALVASAPELASLLPPAAVAFERSSVQADIDRLAIEIDRLQQIVSGPPLGELCDDRATLTSITEGLTLVASAVKTCRHAWEQTLPIFVSMPSQMSDLLAAAKSARTHTASLAEVSAIFEREQSLMPQGAVASEQATWQRTKSGLDAAERLNGLVRSSEKLRDVLCAEGRINRETLMVAADQADAAVYRLDAALRQTANVFVLSPPNEPLIEPQRRPLAVLGEISRAVNSQFRVRTQQLSRLADSIRPSLDISVSRLADDLRTIQSLRDAITRLKELDATLDSKSVESPRRFDDNGAAAAHWLLGQAETNALSPLKQAVAANGEQRVRIRQAVDEIKRAAADEFKASWDFLRSVFDIKSDNSSGIKLIDMPVGKLANHLHELKTKTAALDDWLQFSRWRLDMTDAGFSPVVEELLMGQYEPREAVDVLSARFYRHLFDHLAGSDRMLGKFNAIEHERVRDRFRELDQWEVKVAATRIRQFQLGREDRPRPGWNAPDSSELGILQRETQKKRRHMSLRRLFSEIPGVLQRLKPCIMMSPLSVSTFLQSDEIRFDLVIFDEASQVFPWDAIGAIYRGSQLIVAGDEKQLPPTNFFNRSDLDSDEDDEEDNIGDFESILKLCRSIGMPHKRLRWHYRSRREPLIAFSNRHFYGGDLVTFPSVRDASGDAVRLDFVPNGRWVNRKNAAEADRVAELVIAHHRTRSKNSKGEFASLGVIAFSASQQQAIEDAIYERRRNDPTVEAILCASLSEPMFVKNLENVQGDERDVIILSMGYAKNEAGKFLKNFGPLTKAGGERRLNVAVTRAREAIVLVASVRSADMDLSGSNSEGSHLLKAYLDYAERGVDSLARSVTTIGDDCDSPFEAEVAEALMRRGLKPVPQVGCGGFRIDLGLPHPERPGEFCLGIECDGATYHSSKTARDRDRIRQTILEDLGWNIVRVWSTDWVRNPERQLDRIFAAYELAVSRPASDPSPVTHRDDDTDTDDTLQPRYVENAPSSKKTYASIDVVPHGQILTSAKFVLLRLGAIEHDDLVKQTARELGFAKTGRRIRERIEADLDEELRHGTLRHVGNRVALPATSAPNLQSQD